MEELRSILHKTYRLFEAEEASDALRILSSMPVDVALVDYTVKNGDGMDAMRRIEETFPDIPLVYIAVDPKSPQKKQARATGAFGCIARPIDDEEVLFMVEKAVEKQRLLYDLRHLRSARKAQLEPTGSDSGRSPESRASVYHTEIIRKLSKAITSVHDLNSLISHFSNAVSEIFGATTTMVFLKNLVTKRYEPVSMTGVEQVLFRDVWFDNDHGIARCLYENNQILRRESVEISGHEENYELVRDLKILKGEVIAPLSHQGELLGFISLGKRISGLPYTEEDIELLALISVYTGIALKNALDYQRITYSKGCSESIIKNIRTGTIAINTTAQITNIKPVR